MAARLREPVGPHLEGAEFIRFLGAGGFADVFLYRQDMPRREVAVKVIRSGASAAQKQKFQAESDLMAKFGAHPAVLSLYAAGRLRDGRAYLTMEYCPPPHLGKRFSTTSPMRVEQALEITIKIAGAVETIHRAGYLHRDIKPANILLTAFGHPVLTDFGIAISQDTPAERVDSAFSPYWAPPEQQLNRPLTPASDVYSLAATTYTMLAGRPPHVDMTPGAHNDPASILKRLHHGSIAPIGRNDVPAALERVLFTAMSKRPSDRFASAMAFARALRQIQSSLGLPLTNIDVWEDQPVIAADGSDDDATRLRPVVSISPENTGRTADTNARINTAGANSWGDSLGSGSHSGTFYPNAHQSPADARTFTGNTSGFNRNTTLGSAASPGANTGSGYGTYSASSGLTGPGGPFNPQNGAPAAAGAGAVGPQSGGVGQNGPANSANQPPQGSPEAPGSTLAASAAQDGSSVSLKTLLISALVVVLIGVIAFAAYRGLQRGGLNPKPAVTTAGTAAPMDPDVNGYLEPVTNLKLSYANGQVEATWDYKATNATFLYSVTNSGVPQKSQTPQGLQETSAHRATLKPTPPRTCVQIVARDKAGRESEPVIDCIDTPASQ
jgi:non-specific serine/threonine protein kinase